MYVRVKLRVKIILKSYFSLMNKNGHRRYNITLKNAKIFLKLFQYN